MKPGTYTVEQDNGYGNSCAELVIEATGATLFWLDSDGGETGECEDLTLDEALALLKEQRILTET